MTMYLLVPLVVLIDTVLKTLELHFQIKKKKIISAVLTSICYSLSILTVGLFAKNLTPVLFAIIIISKMISKYLSILIIEKLSKDDIILYHFSFYSKKESKIFADRLRKANFNVRTCDGDYVLNGDSYEKTLLIKSLAFSKEEREKLKKFLHEDKIIETMNYERQEIKLKKIKNALEY